MRKVQHGMDSLKSSLSHVVESSVWNISHNSLNVCTNLCFAPPHLCTQCIQLLLEKTLVTWSLYFSQAVRWIHSNAAEASQKLNYSWLNQYAVFLTVWRKCTLAMSHAAPWWVIVSMPMGKTDRRTDVRPLHYAFRQMQSANNCSIVALTVAMTRNPLLSKFCVTTIDKVCLLSVI